MTRLAQETQILREYAMQVQDVYQSEIEIHQNDVMKMLTIVTTIFLPLTHDSRLVRHELFIYA